MTPRLVVADVDDQVAFLRTVFGATGDVVSGRPVELRIGDSLVMVSSPTGREAMAAFLYVYVGDADEAHDHAVRAGARSLEAPVDMQWGDRRAMVRDPFGNVFQLAHPIDDE